MNPGSGERVVSDWVWQVYDDHGSWNDALGKNVPSHGWRRVVEMRLGPVEMIVTEWHFGLLHPSTVMAGECREIHAVRDFEGAA
jgi:hypothetical protein